MPMELLRDLFLTASLALILSFLVAKLVSFAMAAPDSHGTLMEEMLSGERFTLMGVQGERRVQSVEQTTELVNTSEHTPALVEEAVLPSEQFAEQISSEEDFKDEPEPGTVGFPEKFSEDSSHEVEKEVECDPEGEEVGIGMKTDNDFVEAPEEITHVKFDVVRRNENEKEKELQSDEEDDWEGIERTELDEAFAAAARFVGHGDDGDWLTSTGTDVQMELYGLHKVATEGPCRESQPMAFMVPARAKWNAWQRLGNMNPDMAMERYIALLSDKVPGWMEDHSSNGKKLVSAAGTTSTPDPYLSKFHHPLPECTNERERETDSFEEGCDLTEGSNMMDKAKG